MEIKNVCDRCYENLIENGLFFKYGSANYCFKCHSKIFDEIEEDMVNEALNQIEKMSGEYAKNLEKALKNICEKPKNANLIPFKKTKFIFDERKSASC